MRFIYTAGAYTTFMGRTFAFKKATEVTDKATIEALLKRPDFMRVDDEPKKEPQAAPAPVLDQRFANSEVRTVANVLTGKETAYLAKRPTLTLGKRK